MPHCTIVMHGAEAAACRLLPSHRATPPLPRVLLTGCLVGWHAPSQDYEYEPEEEEHSEEEEHYGDAQSRGEGRPLAAACRHLWSGWLHLGAGLVQPAAGRHKLLWTARRWQLQ